MITGDDPNVEYTKVCTKDGFCIYHISTVFEDIPQELLMTPSEKKGPPIVVIEPEPEPQGVKVPTPKITKTEKNYLPLETKMFASSFGKPNRRIRKKRFIPEISMPPNSSRSRPVTDGKSHFEIVSTKAKK